jgi:hypothetical protein
MSNLPVSLAAAGLFAAVSGSAPAPADAQGYRLAQLTFQQRVVVRVHRATPTQPVVWTEKKGPKCVPLAGLAGALIVQPDAVDLVLAGGDRVRARLDKDCPALNFYSGFYIKPTKDGKVCADRDAVHSRSGRLCEIEGFRKLVAKR